jgi:methyl-accepting chemotaxis protein
MDSMMGSVRLAVTDWKDDPVYVAAAQSNSEDEAAKSARVKLEKLQKIYTYFERVNLANSDGLVVASSDDRTSGKISIGDRPYFQEAMKGTFSVSEVMIGKTTSKPVAMVTAPVKAGDRIVGAISGVLDMDQLNKAYISPVKIGEKGYAFVYGQDSLLLAHPDESLIFKRNMKDADYGRRMIETKQGVLVYRDNGVDMITAYAPLKELGVTVCVTGMMDELLSPIRAIRWISVMLSASMLVVVGVIIFLIARSVARPIDKTAKNLMKAADQVTTASYQVSAAANQVAEGASEQAANLEETTASLEEMSSMTKQNAENANQANTLMRDTKETVDRAGSSMSDLMSSMRDISKASEEISKIIKTIDEIAFQTNLLALNAAVEAARAGEAGAGFAVVADEVRNLAMRASNAAGNTAELIEDTVLKIKTGSGVVEKTNLEFSGVSSSTSKMADLVNEISAASNEQAQGIQQISQAVSKMDEVVQRNAAHAEESAAASEEMKSQAEQVKMFVANLEELIGNRVKTATNREK